MQEMVANPMLEELTNDGPASEDYSEEAFIKAETEKVPETEPANPFDEFDIASFFNQYLDSGSGEGRGEHEVIEKPSFEKFISSPQGLAEHLGWQLSVTVCNDVVREIAEIIIGNLDENGYLTVSLEEISKNGNFVLEDVEEALAAVQEFDPLGVAARNLRECLLFQLHVLDPQNALAHQIVSECMPKRPLAPTEEEQQVTENPLAKLLQANQLTEVARALNRPVELVKRAKDVIRRLDPRPGLRFNKTQAQLVEPEVYFRKMDDGWQVFMNEDDVPQLRLSPVYRRLLARDAADREVRNYVKERFSAALQLMKSIEQRKHTILRVCQSIIRRQGDYLEHGIDHLKPMMIKEVAEEVGVHPSTVSRAVSSKYAHTPQGVIELRSFFSESVNGPEGGAMSLQTLKRVVKKMIDEEDTAHPLTDDHIAKKLAETGIQVTRRTVAKYREDLRIPSTHQRRVKT